MDITKPMTKSEFKRFRKRVDYLIENETVKHNFEQLLKRIEYLQDENSQLKVQIKLAN